MDTKSSERNSAAGFTLVELLVVITIIGILAALITVAAVGALKKAQETRIKSEVNEISTAFEEYKNKVTAYPPNTVTNAGPEEPALDVNRIFSDLKKHLKQIAPRNQEPDDLLRAIAGINVSNSSDFPRRLNGGMTAGEALVFWLSGFSSDPKFPISGEGGPSFEIPGISNSNNRTLEQLSNRQWIYPFEELRLSPRDSNNYFDDSAQSGERFIEYRVVINGQPKFRRINFWQYVPSKSTQPFLYFDTSRNTPNILDPPASAELHVHALKKVENPGSTNERVEFVNPDKFQILHSGIDDAWGEFDAASFKRYVDRRDEFLSFPTGPFSGEVADTIVNFTAQTRLEDAQP